MITGFDEDEVRRAADAIATGFLIDTLFGEICAAHGINPFEAMQAPLDTLAAASAAGRAN